MELYDQNRDFYNTLDEMRRRQREEQDRRFQEERERREAFLRKAAFALHRGIMPQNNPRVMGPPSQLP